MIVAANIGVCDEVELIERHLHHLKAIGVDHIAVTDIGSVDGTQDVLEAYARRGEIMLLRTERDAPDLFSFPKRMLKQTLQVFHPDWVMFGDADEFHLPRSGRIHDALRAATTDSLQVERFNIPLSNDGPLWPEDLSPAAYDDLMLIVRPFENFHSHLAAQPDTAWIMGRVLPKMIAKSVALAGGTQMGGHGVQAHDGHLPSMSVPADILIAHLPVSTRKRFRRKLANIQLAAVSHGQKLVGLQAWQWRRWGQLGEAGLGEQEYARNIFDDEMLSSMRAEGQVMSAKQWFEAVAHRLGRE